MIVVYHRCPTFATGSIGAGEVTWWAEAAPDGNWRVLMRGARPYERPALEAAIRDELCATPAQAAAAAQDARAEAPDL